MTHALPETNAASLAVDPDAAVANSEIDPSFLESDDTSADVDEMVPSTKGRRRKELAKLFLLIVQRLKMHDEKGIAEICRQALPYLTPGEAFSLESELDRLNGYTPLPDEFRDGG